MNSFLRITVRFLQPLAHGRADGGEPEWPPSPLRLFQALTAAAAARWNERIALDYAAPALHWLEQQRHPDIVAVGGSASENPYLLYIPHNAADQLVPAWKQGDITKGVKREQKPVRPTHLSGEAVHYLFPLAEGDTDAAKHLEVLKAAARSVTHLGWGIDMAAADADMISEEEAAKLPGHRWRVVPAGGVPLRVPRAGTLDDLIRKHKDFLERLPDGGGFKPVPPLRCFHTVNYNSDTAPGCVAPGRPFAAFSLLTPDAEQTAAFDKLTGTRDVAALIRHLLDSDFERFGFNRDEYGAYVSGHHSDGGQLRGEDADRRLMFLPLPTINAALGRVESIRRLLVAGPPGDVARIEDIGRRLCGEVLEHNGQPRALLTVLPKSDWVLRQYTGESEVWSTVTPAVFPGHHKGDLDRGNDFARRMFEHAGLPTPSELAWRPVGFRAGAELANRYLRPDKMNGSIYHLRVRFPRKVRGPIAVGAGRYRGFGLLAVDS